MTITEAIAKRVIELCSERETNVCDVCLKAGMSPSNIYDILHKRTKHSRISTIQRFCEGAEITLEQFFASPLFNNLDFED